MRVRRSLLAALVALAALGAAAPATFGSGTITVSKSDARAGTVTGTIPTRNVDGEPTGQRTTIIDCGTDCEEFVEDFETCTGGSGGEICDTHAETVELTQSPAAGWQFTSWTGCGSVTGTTCNRNMSGAFSGDPIDRAVTANYADVGDPTVALTGPVENSKINGLITVGATAADNADVARVEFSINGAAPFATDSVGTDGYSASFDTSAFSHPQMHTLRATAVDTSGHTSPLQDDDDRDFRIDRQTGVHFEAPTPAENEWVGIGDPAVQVAFAKNDDTPADTVTFTCNLGAGFAACTSPLGAENFDDDGTYAVTVQATDDAAPVANTAQVTRTFRIDRTAPVVTLTRPADDSDQPPSFTPEHSVVEANPADTGSLTCSLDGGAFATCGALSGLSGGAHTFAVKAVDKAGNETVVTHDFNVDGTPPSAEITDGPAQNEIIRTDDATFTFTATDPSTPLALSCRVDGGFGPCDSPTTHSASGLSEGAHFFELRVTDAAGNAVTRRRDFVVNAVRPTVAITGGPGEGAVIKSTEATFTFTTTGGTVRCSLDSETAFGPCTSAGSHRVTGLADGGHTFRVRVRDASNDEVMRSRTFTVDTSVPPPQTLKRPPPITQTVINEILRAILNPSLSTRFAAFRRYTVYKRLVLRNVPEGATVTATCKGRRCPARSVTLRRSGNVKLTRFLKKRLRVGTKLTIRVTKPGAIGKQFVIRIRRSRAPKLTISQIA